MSVFLDRLVCCILDVVMTVFLARLDVTWLMSSWERVLEAAVRGAWHQRGRHSTGVCLPRELENPHVTLVVILTASLWEMGVQHGILGTVWGFGTLGPRCGDRENEKCGLSNHRV